MNDLTNVILAAFRANPEDAAARLYLATGILEKQNIETGLNRKALVVTDKNAQSKTNALPCLIVDKARGRGCATCCVDTCAWQANNSTGAAKLSPLGELVLRLDNFGQAFDVDKTNALNFVETKEEVKVAKQEINTHVANRFGLTKANKGNGTTCNVCKVHGGDRGRARPLA